MNPRLLNTVEDMRWLRQVHLPLLPAEFHSAVVSGNEDSPDRIDVYFRTDPLISDKPMSYYLVDGIYKVIEDVNSFKQKR